jgi:signal transduction histidine kinase
MTLDLNAPRSSRAFFDFRSPFRLNPRPMPGQIRARSKEGSARSVHSLSGRLLLLTLVYVLVSEVLIFVPSIGRFHRQLLDDHIQSSELAILPFTEPGGEALSEGLRNELLKRAGAAAVLLKRADQKQLFLVDKVPRKVDLVIDLGTQMSTSDMVDAVDCLLHGGNRILHVVAPTRVRGAQSIGIVLGEAPIHAALVAYSWRITFMSLFISLTTALLVFASLYFVFVRPMARLTRAMVDFRQNPEDPARIVEPGSRKDEIGIAERELYYMQRDLFGSLQQKTRLAALGAAVARIQHDLKNILSSAQLASDRLTAIDDPLVKRLTPRLVASLDRAVALAASTLRYGHADERAPERKQVALKPLIEEAAESAIAAGGTSIRFVNGIDPGLHVEADADQLYRMILNLVRNAVEALMEAGAGEGEIKVSAARAGGEVTVEVCDNGPGIPEQVRPQLFQPFSTARAGGSGLGLAIARELARGHGGDVELIATDSTGTRFRISIPDGRAP